jgi:HSP20 family protein
MYHFELKPPRRNNVWNAHSQWEKEIEKFFDVFSKSDYIAPPCEVLDGEKIYTISLDVPGLRKDDLDIEVKDNHLHISGERKSSVDEKDNVLRSERRYGKFSRVFNLPQNINTDAIEARFENGVLEIALPKEEKSQSKKIAISDWSKENTVEMKN